METPLTEAAATVAAALLGLLLRVGWALASEWLMASRMARVAGAARRAAGQIVEELRREPAAAEALDRLVEAGADYVTGAMGQTLARLGADRARAAQLVRGELGVLLAAAPLPLPAMQGLAAGWAAGEAALPVVDDAVPGMQAPRALRSGER